MSADPSTTAPLPGTAYPQDEAPGLAPDRPDSPCIGICSTLFDEICQGCGRTASEVSNWVFFSDEEKQVVWARITAEGTARRFVRTKG
ncbi:DUF1289 domain-containing protein [Cupriavidus plantarum]|uniref:DUF1289 domain-containing protein n=1 Tax=Cupriavidus plantarum TaxID=942865 RepID=UPI000EB16828|nr:DUF1289 domain-containing protein [Cupriavidus plantarum]NYI00070.1 hypothetical protein [Cupriavidus plantarum]RLK45152.1 hypothetical protein C7417_1159 [Cupriavidus plantarum]